jgi:hypothetical protein
VDGNPDNCILGRSDAETRRLIMVGDIRDLALEGVFLSAESG